MNFTCKSFQSRATNGIKLSYLDETLVKNKTFVGEYL